MALSLNFVLLDPSRPEVATVRFGHVASTCGSREPILVALAGADDRGVVG